MEKSRKQILTAMIALVAILACYFGVKEYSESVSKKQEEEEAAKIKQVTSFEIADVTAFSYSSADLEVSFELEGETWKCVTDETLEIDTEKIESFLENFNAIESENELTDSDEEFGLETPNASITFVFAEGESLTCTVGDYNDVLSVYYFTTDASDAVYTVDGTVVSKLSNTVENFVVEETEEDEEESSEEETDTVDIAE